MSVEKDGSRVLVRPVKSGAGIMLYAEAEMSEMASELCGFYEDMLKSAQKFSEP